MAAPTENEKGLLEALETVSSALDAFEDAYDKLEAVGRELTRARAVLKKARTHLDIVAECAEDDNEVDTVALVKTAAEACDCILARTSAEKHTVKDTAGTRRTDSFKQNDLTLRNSLRTLYARKQM